MAITPRSFGLNPTLVIIAALAAVGVYAGIGALCTTSCPYEAERVNWTPEQWAFAIDQAQDEGDGERAYDLASRAVEQYPNHAYLLNLRGFVASRNGDHGLAAHDFREGLQRTGSPTGVFENNIAWSMLYSIDDLQNPDRADRALQQARNLIDESFSKGWSCERAHTGLFVEYAAAELGYAADDDIRVRKAVTRYISIYAKYQGCLHPNRLMSGDEITVEELYSAAIMDARMGELAGIMNPTRHLHYQQRAADRADELGIEIDAEWCEQVIPVGHAADLCAN